MSQDIEVYELNQEKVELIKNTIAKGATDDELSLFIQVCNRTQLDPFARQIYAVSRWDGRLGRNVMQTQISIDGARLVAQRSGEYGGQTPVQYCGADKVWTDLWLDSDGYPAAAKVAVYRAGFVEPLWATATWTQYVQTKKGGEITQMWKQMPALMLSKCAEMLALRKAFPMELSGLYSAEEMGQADNPQPPKAKAETAPKEKPPTTRRAAPSTDVTPDGEILEAEVVEPAPEVENIDGDARREEIVALLNSIEDHDERVEAKKTFAEVYGHPMTFDAEQVDEAFFIAKQYAKQAHVEDAEVVA
jgi:phage recombination protein Bet